MRKAILIIAVAASFLFSACAPQDEGGPGERVELQSDDWTIVGDLALPEAEGPVPAVLLLHMMPTDRSSYANMAGLLAERGIASLRIDLRGHGESINLGEHNSEINAEAWRDVLAAFNYLKEQEAVDPERIGILGASYSGEQAARAGIEGADAAAWVIMSSGSFSEESIGFVSRTRVRWQFIAAEDDGNPAVPELMKRAAAVTPYAKETIFAKGGHGTYMFQYDKYLEKKIADWFFDELTQ
jgi:dienelactone hydrolase